MTHSNIDFSLYFFKWKNSDDELATQIQEAEAKAPEDLTEEDKMALLGRPKNGDIMRAQLRIKESKEFKVSGQFLNFLNFKCLNCRKNYLLIKPNSLKYNNFPKLIINS